MKKFLFSFILFTAPFILMIAGIELYVRYYPSTFNIKAKYLSNNNAIIETVVLGSSHNQNALNPAYFKSNTINLANAGQDIQLDAALFFKYIPKLPSVKEIILELDYHTMEEINDSTYFRLPWYNKFYEIELYPISILHRTSIYASSPSFFNKLLLDELNPRKIRYTHNQYGFILNDFPGVMEDLKYDTLLIAETAFQRLKDKHKNKSTENFRENRTRIDSIINYCIANKIRIFLVSTPMYSTYIKNQIPEKNNRRYKYIDSLEQLPNTFYYNFENTDLFDVYDFKNDDHLNSKGAIKFSKIMNEIIQEKRKIKN